MTIVFMINLKTSITIFPNQNAFNTKTSRHDNADISDTNFPDVMFRATTIAKTVFSDNNSKCFVYFDANA